MIYAYPFVLLNPLELKATPAKERMFFSYLSWYNSLHTNRKLVNPSLNKDDSCLGICRFWTDLWALFYQDKHIDYSVIKLIFE